MNETDPIALYLVVRESLNMEAGKLTAQVGHAVDRVVSYIHELDLRMRLSGFIEIRKPTATEYDILNLVEKWRERGSRKITLSADENEWSILKTEFGPSIFIVVDSGLTDLKPNTETVIGFLPQYKSARPKILRRLKPLKGFIKEPS